MSEWFDFEGDLLKEGDTTDVKRPSSQMSGGGKVGDDGSTNDSEDSERVPSPFPAGSNDNASDAWNSDDDSEASATNRDNSFNMFDSPSPARTEDREEGELPPSEDEEDDIPFEYDNDDPPRTATKEGFFAFNCLKRLDDHQYLNIISN
uniref:Uncharacterized protein n=1 Tax=Panagrolaimus superbus TaxID=310955 RepID=A0A914Y307_9BILA